MTVVMTRQISGARNGMPWPAPGEPVPSDASDAEVAELIAQGHATEDDGATTKSSGVDAETGDDGDGATEGSTGDKRTARKRSSRKTSGD